MLGFHCNSCSIKLSCTIFFLLLFFWRFLFLYFLRLRLSFSCFSLFRISLLIFLGDALFSTLDRIYPFFDAIDYVEYAEEDNCEESQKYCTSLAILGFSVRHLIWFKLLKQLKINLKQIRLTNYKLRFCSPLSFQISFFDVIFRS